MQATIVIDPGHGGAGNIGGSDGNHAVSPSGVKEKNLTFILANLLQTELATIAQTGGHTLKVVMTRTKDVNLSLAARANFAKTHKADRFLSIHLNGFNKVTRGVETYIRRAQDNVNLNDDRRFATKIQKSVFGAIKALDAGTKDRGVKEEKFGVLNDVSLGNTTGGHCRACMIEVEFMDVPAVDVLLNTGPKAASARVEIAKAMAAAIIDDLMHP